MTWLAIRAFFGGALKGIVGWLGHRSFWQLVCMGLALFAVVQHFQLVTARHSATKWHGQFDAEHAARLADRKSYAGAQTAAAVQNKAQVAKVEQQYQRNSDNERQNYLDDLARLRAGSRKLQQTNAATERPASGAGSSAPSTATARIDETGLCVPATSDVCEAGAEIELRLMHLQNLFDLQSAVDPNAH